MLHGPLNPVNLLGFHQFKTLWLLNGNGVGVCALQVDVLRPGQGIGANRQRLINRYNFMDPAIWCTFFKRPPVLPLNSILST